MKCELQIFQHNMECNENGTYRAYASPHNISLNMEDASKVEEVACVSSILKKKSQVIHVP
jgi:hypothetical protein